MTASAPRRSWSACQSSSASPTRSGGLQRVHLVARAGEADDAELHSPSTAPALDLVVLDQRVGQQLLAHRVQLRRVLDVELHQPADVDVGSRPRSRAPAARARPSGPADRGSRPSAGSGRAPSLARPCAPARPRTARRPAARRRSRSARASRRPRRRGSPAPAASCPSRCRRPSRARTACRTTAGRGPARTRRPARSARSPACRPRRRAPASPSASSPNSNFVSARITPRSRAWSAIAP